MLADSQSKKSEESDGGCDNDFYCLHIIKYFEVQRTTTTKQTLEPPPQPIIIKLIYYY
jgi:hypothetical protein